MHEACRNSGAQLVLISPALCKELTADTPRTSDIVEYRRILERVAAEHGIPLFTVPELTERAEGPTRQYFVDVFHLNKAGHDLFAQRLEAFLAKNNLLTTVQSH